MGDALFYFLITLGEDTLLNHTRRLPAYVYVSNDDSPFSGMLAKLVAPPGPVYVTALLGRRFQFRQFRLGDVSYLPVNGYGVVAAIPYDTIPLDLEPEDFAEHYAQRQNIEDIGRGFVQSPETDELLIMIDSLA